MLKNYVLTAWKVFMRRKLFTAINLLCIVLTLVVLLVVTALLQNAFFPSGVEGRSARFLQVVMMQSNGPGGHRQRTSPLGYRLIAQYLKPMPALEAVSAVTLPQTVSVYQGDRVSSLLMRRADAQYWQVLNFTLLSGRVFNDDDMAHGRFVAVVNASTAARLFPGAPATGQHVDIGGQSFEIIGVVEDALQFNAYSDIWAPITTFPTSDYRQQLTGNFVALLMARHAADLPQVRRDVARIARTVVFDDPHEWSDARFWADSKLDLFARTLGGSLGVEDSGAARLLAIVGAVMLLFMLLPALNLVNLNMGRIMERSGEIGVRRAFGATSTQLVWQLLIENVLLCLAGGVLSLVCAKGVLMWLEASTLIPYLKVSLDFAVFGYGLVITLIFGLLSGVIPAWKMSRLDPVFALKGAA